MRRRLVGLCQILGLGVGLGVGLSVGAAGPAQAHTALVRLVPANGATVRTPPAAVELVFNETLRSRYQAVTVTAPNGDRVSQGAPTVSGTVIRQALGRLPGAGRYTVTYRVVSADGHPIADRAGFTYDPVAAPTPPATDPASPPAGPATGTPPGPAAGAASPGAGEGNAGISTGATVAMSVFGAGGVALAGALFWRRRRAT